MNTISSFKKKQKRAYTPQQMIELKKCFDDPIYFIENYVYIQTLAYDVIKFKMFDYQKQMVKNYEDNRFVISMLSRQMGKSDLTMAYLLWFVTFHSNKRVLLAAYNFNAVSELMTRVKFMYENLPDWLRAPVKADGYNARSLKFINNSIIEGVATTPRSARGKTIAILYIDELSFVQPGMAKEFWASILPTISTGGKCFITSTPGSDDDQFAQIWQGAINTIDEQGNTIEGGIGRNGFKAFKAIWRERPDRDEKWAAQEKAKVGEILWRREFELEFINFNETLINPTFLSEKINSYGKEPILRLGQVRFYQKLQPNKTYLLGLDPSLGTGGDPAAIQIFQLPEMIQVGEWKDNTTPIPDQINLLRNILRYIHNDLRNNELQQSEPEIYWTIENNTIGEGALISIDEMGIDTFPGNFMSESKISSNGRRTRKGFNTTNKSKIEACIKLKQLIETERMQIASKALIRELKFFIASGNTYKAQIGETDDLVSATLLIIRLIKELSKWDSDVMNSYVIDMADEIIEPLPIII